MALWSRFSYPMRLFGWVVVYTLLLAGAYFLLMHHEEPDTGAFLWVMLIVSTVMVAAAFIKARRMDLLIKRLEQFAARADRGERIYETAPFPNDSLGAISNHIVRLYARLQDAQVSRDREHRAAIIAEEDKNRLKKQLTNNINHELKTPVAMIEACLETIVNHPDMAPQKCREFTDRAYAASQRLRKMLEDVATVTRMDDAPLTIRRESVNISALLADIADDFSLQADARGMRLSLRVVEGIWIDGNPTLLRSMVSNLITNSLHYSEGTEIIMTLSCPRAGECVITVADDGVGVPPEHLPHIFERFYRVDKGRSRAAGGTGLGLAIVRNAVQLHGGAVTVRLRPAGGLEFVITLPANTGDWPASPPE